MRPVFKCEYCNFMSTEDKVNEHETNCIENYTRRSCFTCKHRGYKNLNQLECACGREIPKEKIWEFCPQYERKEKSETPLSNLFGGMFGGFV